MYTKQHCHKRPEKISSMNLCCVGGAFVRPNGMEIHSQSPNFVMNAVFSMSFSATAMDQNASVKSMVEKYFASPSWASISSILGKGYASLAVISLSFL